MPLSFSPRVLPCAGIVLAAVLAGAAQAAPLVLFDPAAINPSAATPNTLTSQTTIPGKTCGDLATPCQNLAAPAPPKPLPPPAFGQGFTYGGSVSTTFAATTHGGTGEGVGVSGWIQSPDGNWTLAIAASVLNANGPGYAQFSGPAGGFGRPR